MNFPKAKHSELREGNKGFNSVKALSQIVGQNCRTTMVAVMFNFRTESWRQKKKWKRVGDGWRVRREGERKKMPSIIQRKLAAYCSFSWMFRGYIRGENKCSSKAMVASEPSLKFRRRRRRKWSKEGKIHRSLFYFFSYNSIYSCKIKCVCTIVVLLLLLQLLLAAYDGVHKMKKREGKLAVLVGNGFLYGNFFLPQATEGGKRKRFCIFVLSQVDTLENDRIFFTFWCFWVVDTSNLFNLIS